MFQDQSLSSQVLKHANVGNAEPNWVSESVRGFDVQNCFLHVPRVFAHLHLQLIGLKPFQTVPHKASTRR